MKPKGTRGSRVQPSSTEMEKPVRPKSPRTAAASGAPAELQVLREWQRRFIEVMDQLPVYLILLSPDYRIPFLNQFFRDRFGDPGGKRCHEYLFQRSEPCEICETYKVLKTGEPLEWDWTGPDGRNYHIHDYPFTDTDGSTLIMEVGLDVTDHKRAEAELSRHRDNLETLVRERTAALEAEIAGHRRTEKELGDSRTAAFNLLENAIAAQRKAEEAEAYLALEVAERRRAEENAERLAMRNALLSRTAAWLLSSSSPPAIVEDLCRQVMEFLSCDVFFNYLLDEPTGRLHLNACAGIPPEEARRIGWLDYGVAVCGCVARDRQRIVVEDIQNMADPRTTLVKSYGMQAYCCHPLLVRDRLIGTLSFGSRSRTRFSEDDIALMREVTGLTAIAMDRMQTEQALREIGRDLNRAQAVAQIGSWRLDLRSNRIDMSEQNWRILGVSPGALPNYEAVLALVYPDDRPSFDATWKAALKGAPLDAEHRIVVDGKIKWIRELGELEFDDQGNPLGGFGTSQDIIERKRMEQVMLEVERLKVQERSQKIWQNTFDGITDLISVHDRDGSIMMANRAFLDTFDLSLESLHQKRCYELFHEDGRRHPNCPMPETFRTGLPQNTEISENHRGRTFDVSTFPFLASDGNIEGTIHIAKDVTERKETEMRLILGDRLAALGQMASGIAHELNNPLASISGCAESLQSRADEGPIETWLLREYLEIIREEIARCKSITGNMLSFVRKGAAKKQVLSVTDTLDRTLELIGFQGRLLNVEVVKAYQESPLSARAAEAELKQVYVILLANALDAQKDRGKLEVSAGGNGARVWVRVKDSGAGIPPEAVGRIFDPFFSTKAHGTGLGLSIARKIVESLGGDAHPRGDRGPGIDFPPPVAAGGGSRAPDSGARRRGPARERPVLTPAPTRWLTRPCRNIRYVVIHRADPARRAF